MKQKGSEGSEKKILNAAMKEFALRGYAGARVDTIAEKAKVNKAMIYYHFKNKEKLYERILKDIIEGMYRQVNEAAVAEGDSTEVFYSIIGRYIDMLSSFDISFYQIMLREIASGGEFFRKIAIPNLAVPVFNLINTLISSAIKKGEMRDVNPYYTFLQIIGGIIFFNVIRIPLKGSELEKRILVDGYIELFRENLFKILSDGLEYKGGKL